MNLRERLQVRALVNLVISILERIVDLIIKLSPKNKNDINIPDDNPKPHRPRPFKRLIDNIPLPWKKSNE